MAEADASAFKAAEQKGVIFPKWSTQGAAELLLLVGRLGRAIRICKEIRPIERAVAGELASGPVYLVGSGLGGHEHLAAHAVAVLRRELARDHAELFEGID